MTESHVVARWEEAPYTSHRRRGHTVQHRVVLEHYGGAGADVRHEVRSTDDNSVPSEWSELDTYELRDHGIRELSGPEEVLRQ